jgi:hypothetical protein
MDGKEVTTEITSRFSWNYAVTIPKVADLYEKGKISQWNPRTDIDWDVDVQFGTPLPPLPADSAFPYPLPAECGISETTWNTFRWEHHAWTVSQFLHGEQGALLAAARLVEMAPDIDSKFFAATQVADEARHVEVFSRYLREKLGHSRPIDESISTLLANILTENEWDIVFLGMQIIAEGYALASFRLNRALFPDPLITEITGRVARDEARHMSFGLLALDGRAEQMTSRERLVREEFICDALSLLTRHVGIDRTWRDLGLGSGPDTGDTPGRERMAAFKRTLFTRVLPSIARIGLFSPRVREQCGKLGLGPR